MASTETSSLSTDRTASESVDIPQVVRGKVCGTPPLDHTGMIKLRILGQHTGIRYTYRGDGISWRMAYAHK